MANNTKKWLTKRDISTLPGGKLISQGLVDVKSGKESMAALLVFIGFPRLRELGLVDVINKDASKDPELRLYRLLTKKYPNDAHSKYNSYIRSLVSFERACEHKMRRYLEDNNL